MTTATAAEKKPSSIPQMLAAATLLGVMAAGAWQVLRAACVPGGLDVPRGAADFREGRTTGELQRLIDRNLPAREQLIAAANSARYLLTRGGGEKVRVGKDGWLFLTDELRFHPGGDAHLQARAALLGAAARELDRQGTKLIVALVPDKARIHADKLAGGAYPRYLATRYPDALAAMRNNGVTVVDLLAPLAGGSKRETVYYRSDTHWNQAGARLAAQAIAAAVRQAGIRIEQTAFTTVAAGAPAERAGDLIRLMGLDNMPNALRPPPDVESPATTRQASADAGGGLFGDAGMPVVLTGTSYSLRANFHGYLQQALSAKVLNTAKDGGGFLTAASEYLSNDAFRSDKPKVLIWELPERFLQEPLEKETGWLARVGLAR